MEKILLVEDDAILRQEVAEWLAMESYVVHPAATGPEGLALALNQTPDLIISDITMPGMDGYTLLAEIQARPETAALPFIFLTARADRNEVRHGMVLGATDYITKPFTHQELLTAVRTNLQRKAAVKAMAGDVLETMLRHLTRTLPHEMRTPLNGIIGFADLLLNQDFLAPEEIRDAGQYIADSARRLHHLVENYLTYVHLQTVAADGADSMACRACAADVAAVVTAACRAAANAAMRSDDLKLALAPAHVAVQTADLHKIVAEVAGNAFKFSLHGRPVVVSGESNARGYELRIVDQGRGMSPAQVRSIGAFAQFDRDLYEQQGAGLGAAIAAQLVQLYGGSVDIESQVEVGTTVRIRLPLTKEAAEAPLSIGASPLTAAGRASAAGQPSLRPAAP